MGKFNTVAVFLVGALTVCVTIVAISPLIPTANTGFRDASAVLAFATGAAIGIERTIEALWTLLGGTIGAYWPLNIVAAQARRLVTDINEAVAPVIEQVREAAQEIEQHRSKTGAQLKSVSKELENVEQQLNDIARLAPSNQRVTLLATVAIQTVDDLATKYGSVVASLDMASQMAKHAIGGAQDVLAALKDNPGRRLISIFLGANIGVVIAALFGLDIFTAILETVMYPKAGVILTGLVLGLGASPTHEVIRAVQEFKETYKGANSRQAEVPDVRP